ncbi:uncharacterized protein F5891DRAFT_220823 [Suillus fuscotomentosus]|uniref:Uncharacterized protein n=1 Tax=Suillus fuscotomentosus TaxID=1912939 RepID=A0AAD4HTC0_9AGAM|nr:uncharacterized protein F5891DRAFT_220823 [Suillus fuscotomentosus]KAG1907947.1 hypothetical protein F5891DRAFT_220823 [Suillus fuscotomentosus]
MLPVEKGRRLGRQPVTALDRLSSVPASAPRRVPSWMHSSLTSSSPIHTPLPHPSCILPEPLLAGQCRDSDDWSGYRMSDRRIRCHVNENHIIWPSTTCPLAADIHYGIKYLGLQVCHGHLSTYFYSMERKGHHSSPYSYHRVPNIKSFFFELVRGGIQRRCSINDHEHLAATLPRKQSPLTSSLPRPPFTTLDYTCVSSYHLSFLNS